MPKRHRPNKNHPWKCKPTIVRRKDGLEIKRAK